MDSKKLDAGKIGREILVNATSLIIAGVVMGAATLIYQLITAPQGAFTTFLSSLSNTRYYLSIIEIALIVILFWPVYTILAAKFRDLYAIYMSKTHFRGKMNVGAVRDFGVFKLRLSDISVREEEGEQPPALFDLLGPNDSVVDQLKVYVGNTIRLEQIPHPIILLKVHQTAGGFTLNAKWADIEVKVFEG